MSLSRFFIDRPIFAWVLAIVLMLAGAVSVASLPVAQFPSIAPPTIAISVVYPGASAETAQSTVTQVIEQQMSGLNHLLYFTSESDKDGTIVVQLSFAQGTDPDIAQVQVQNKLQLALPRLPQEVQKQGISVAKAQRTIALFIGLTSMDDRLSAADLSDFVVSYLQDPISRIPGVGNYEEFGSPYAMRVWLDPAKLDNFGLTPGDVEAAIQAQNVQVTSGELGGLPALSNQQLNATIVGPSYLTTPEQFGAILLRVKPDGGRVLLRDVARVALGAESFAITGKYKGHPASGMGIELSSDSNLLATTNAIYATMNRLRDRIPPGVEVSYPVNTAPFVQISVHNVVETLLIAIVLVFLIMFLFLQNLRATLIPTIAVPVVLLGNCAVLQLVGFSLNTLTLFGMVLAIGLLVDDAIVVVENVERVMEEEGLSPRDATVKSMDEISGALVGIGVVLAAVFLPMALFSGSIGVIYRQFSVTIVSSMALSVAVALIFTPALCATILRAPDHRKRRGLFGLFNRTLVGGTRRYVVAVRRIIAHPVLAMIASTAIVVLLGVVFVRIPTGFLPAEDQGIAFCFVSLPPGATAARTQKVLDTISDYITKSEARDVRGVYTINGFNFGGRGQSSGQVFIELKDWSLRPGVETSVAAIVGRVQAHFATYKDARIFVFSPPALLELGDAEGFDFELMDDGAQGHAALLAARDQLLAMAAKDPRLMAVRQNGLDDEPQYAVDIDREKANAQGVTIADINSTLSAAWGSAYVNDFIDRGRVKRVFVQGNAGSRMLPEQLGDWYVRNGAGQMVPFSSFASGRWTYGSPKLERYNGISSIEILGEPAPGQSSGTAMKAMDELAAKLPPGFGHEWTGLSYEEQRAGSQTTLLYAGSLVVVFLCLAALYESWAIPVAVLLVVPFGVVGAVLATSLRGLDNNVYFQIALLTTIGLSAKNAILIVEFGKAAYDSGQSLTEAALTAARERLRPILMTSAAFLLGVFPLAVATGAGSGGQHAIGTGVVGGMLSATVLAIFLVPAFFVIVLGLARVKRAGERVRP